MEIFSKIVLLCSELVRSRKRVQKYCEYSYEPNISANIFQTFFSILLAFLYNDLKYRQLHIPSYFLFFLHISCIKQAIIVYHAVFTASIKWNKKVYKALNPQNPSRRHPHPTPYYYIGGSISKDQCNAASSPLMGRRISPVRIIRIHIFRYCKSFLGSILLHRTSGTALQKS